MEASPAADQGAPARPGWVNRFWYGVLATLVLATLFAFSAPGSYFFPVIALMYAWPLFILIAIVCYLVPAIRRRAMTPLRVPLVAVVALVGTGAAVAFDVPILARFAASQPAMNTLVTEAARNPGLERERGRVGLWPAERIEGYEGGVRFLVRGTGFSDPSGFAYSTNGTPPNLGGEDHYRRLIGNWYVWTESW